MTSGISNERAERIRETKGKGGKTCKTSFLPLEKRNFSLYQNVQCQNPRRSSIELLARVSRGHADLHSVLRSSAMVRVCCVSENLFECGRLCVGVQRIFKFSVRLHRETNTDKWFYWYRGSKAWADMNRAKLKQWHNPHAKRSTDLRVNSHV